MDTQHTRAQNLLLRKNFLDKQKAMNYQNEYDRVRGLLSQNIIRDHEKFHTIRGADRYQLMKRQEELESLGAK